MKHKIVILSFRKKSKSFSIEYKIYAVQGYLSIAIILSFCKKKSKSFNTWIHNFMHFKDISQLPEFLHWTSTNNHFSSNYASFSLTLCPGKTKHIEHQTNKFTNQHHIIRNLASDTRNTSKTPNFIQENKKNEPKIRALYTWEIHQQNWQKV